MIPTQTVKATKGKAKGSKRDNLAKKSGETRCRKVLERITGFKWPTVRPEWLKKIRSGDADLDKKHGLTGRCLELDMFCTELAPKGKRGVAIEVQGLQHRRYMPGMIHKTYADFERAQANDQLKAAMCRDQGVVLIYIHDHELDATDLDDPQAFEQFLWRKLGEALKE